MKSKDSISERMRGMTPEESIKLESVEDETINSRSLKEFSYSFTNSESNASNTDQSEFVGFEARKQGMYKNTQEEVSEESKEINNDNYIYSSG